MSYIKKTKQYGRGVYADRYYVEGDIIEISEILILSEKDTKKVNETDLKFYTFKYNDKQDCLVLGNGEIYNHSDNPNVSFKLNKKTNKMVFKALKFIKAGQQMFTNYNEDVKVDTKKYTKNLI
jgi:uncharacterized protein